MRQCVLVFFSQPKFQCICESGWQSSAGNPACVTDVNECELPNKPCSTNPVVPCFNTEGSFYCGACPAGNRLSDDLYQTCRPPCEPFCLHLFAVLSKIFHSGRLARKRLQLPRCERMLEQQWRLLHHSCSAVPEHHGFLPLRRLPTRLGAVTHHIFEKLMSYLARIVI